MLEPQQVRSLVIRPVIRRLGLWSPAAERLLLGTALTESGLRHLRQVRGPARRSMAPGIYPRNQSADGLNDNNVNDPDMDRVLDAQRAETDLEAKKVLWQAFWDLLHDRVYDIYYPVGLARRAWHNNVINYRQHGLMDGWICYAHDQVRAMWSTDADGLKP